LLQNFCEHSASKNIQTAGLPVLAKASNQEVDCANIVLPVTATGQVEIVDKRLKSMMRELGDAINNSLSDSDEIADVIARIKAGGYDVFVVLEATIGFNQHDAAEGETLESSSADFKITPQDMKFLKSLRIRVEE
jgi:enoyl-[acyl-carrier-protein] reductase (NADH)